MSRDRKGVNDVLWVCPKGGKVPCGWTDWQPKGVQPACRPCKKAGRERWMKPAQENG